MLFAAATVVVSQLAQTRVSTSLRFPFACLANKGRKLVITPVYIKHANEADIIRARGVGVAIEFPTGRRL